MVQLVYKEARALLVILDLLEARALVANKAQQVILEARAQLVLMVPPVLRVHKEKQVILEVRVQVVILAVLVILDKKEIGGQLVIQAAPVHQVLLVTLATLVRRVMREKLGLQVLQVTLVQGVIKEKLVQMEPLVILVKRAQLVKRGQLVLKV